MKKATLTTLLGYIVLILVSFYNFKYWLNWLANADEGSLPASKELLIAIPIVAIVPYLCYATFFALVLCNKLNKGLGIAGAALALFVWIISHIVWNSNTDYSLFSSWFFLITSLSMNLLMLLYFCNLKANWVSPKVSSIGACVSFVCEWCFASFVIYQNYSLTKDYLDSFEQFLSFNLPQIISLIASVMASAFFFAMAKNILKNGEQRI